MNQDVEHRLMDTFAEVAGKTSAHDNWEQVVAEARSSSPRKSRLGTRSSTFAVAASACVLLGVGAVVWRDQTQDRTTVAAGVDYVLPGEVVVDEDPLTVVAALGPVPEFDTDDLGSEMVFEVMDGIDAEVEALVAQSSREPGPFTEASLTKVTLLGRVQGEPWIITVLDGPNVEQIGGTDPRDNFRFRQVVGAGGGSGTGDPVPINSLELIAPPAVEYPVNGLGPSFSAPTGWLTWGPLLADTAVVTFADSDQRLWMRPRAGMVVLPVQFDVGESFTLQAFDAAGEPITSYTETVSYGEDAAQTNPKVGDNVGVTRGTDQDGQAITIEPNGTRTALIFGASWCQPCEQGLDPARAAIEALDPSMRIYSVPHYSDETWPTGTDWPYPRLSLEPQNQMNAVGALPTVIVLDGDNAIVFVHTGFEDVAEALKGLELD